MKIGRYYVNKEGERLVGRTKCSVCERLDGLCNSVTVKATKTQLKRLLAGKLEYLSGNEISYGPKTIKIGCTIVRRSQIQKALEML